VKNEELKCYFGKLFTLHSSFFTQMKLAWLFPVLLAVAGVGVFHERPNAPVQAEPAQTPVLVELFTAEGCSSCPPAERYLNEVAARPDRDRVKLIPIAFHVDYWDKLGWKDRFSQAAFTARQQEYRKSLGEESVYTPQMVVGGKEGFTGSDRKTAEKVFRSTAIEAALPLSFALAGRSSQASLTLTLPEELQIEEEDRLYLVWTQSGLKTHVGDGENRGKTLTHEAVALSLMEMPVKEQAVLEVPAHEAGSPLQLVVFIQNKDDKRVKAVGVKTFE
jgi:hypothetical protein